jgi:hypothetical protein
MKRKGIMINLLRVDQEIAGIIIRFPVWIKRLYCTHNGKVFKHVLTVKDRNKGKKSPALCTNCQKDLGLI